VDLERTGKAKALTLFVTKNDRELLIMHDFMARTTHKYI
jgi:hypothetical protein